MTKKEKLIEKLLTKPKDFTFKEVQTLLHRLGFEEGQSGKTIGSRVFFYHCSGLKLKLHKPHGDKKNLYRYELELIKEIIEELKD
jgi:hypothetical protein